MKGPIIFSNSFREFLTERAVEHNCRISKVLLRIRSVTDKGQSYYVRKWNESHTQWYHERRDIDSLCYYVNDLITTAECNYLTFRNNGTISYLPAGREHLTNESGEWKRDGRQEAKPIKVIRKVIKKRVIELLKITDSEFEDFANCYKSKYSNDGVTIEILPSKAIPEAYDMERIDKGTLGGSCMNGDSEYLDIYKYCENLRIVVMLNREQKLIGRALLWNIEAKNNCLGIDFEFLDRFYVASDHLYETFKELAKNNGWYRKYEYSSYSDKTLLVSPEGETHNVRMAVYTDTDHSQYPYIDTFSYGSDGVLFNTDKGEHTYNNTDGTRDGGDDDYDEIECDYTDRSYSSDEIVYTYESRHCYIGRAVEVRTEGTPHSNYGRYVWAWESDDNIVELRGNYYFKNSDVVRYSDRDDEYYHEDHCVFSDYIEDYIYEGDAILVENTDYKYVHREDLEDYDIVLATDGKYYEKTDENIVEYADQYFLITDEEIVEIDGEYFHAEDSRIAYDENTDTYYILNTTNQ